MKTRYESLDGLRGIAALTVFFFHFMELLFKPEHNPVRYSYLSVDFFFALSGFVMGYAYDNRISTSRMNLKQFFIRRLIRLHPLVIFGTLFGLAGYLFDPFVGDGHVVGTGVSFRLLLINLLLGLFLIPSPSLPNSFSLTHSLNAPSWSLSQEYLANIIYGLFGKRLGKRSLLCAVIISITGLVLTSLHCNGLSIGWGWGEYGKFWAAPVRMAASFLLGLMIFRFEWKIKLPHTFVISACALAGVFIMPIAPQTMGIYDLFCVLVIFPLIIMTGAAEQEQGKNIRRICNLLGRLSYPVYMLHYPLIWWFYHWLKNGERSALSVWSTVIITYAGGILFSYLVLIWYDEPIRKWLTKRNYISA